MATLQEWIKQLGSGSDADQTRKFGTFAGIFAPTVLTILGAIMYLRLGWVVGNTDLLGGLVIILLAHVITIPFLLLPNAGSEYFRSTP